MRDTTPTNCNTCASDYTRDNQRQCRVVDALFNGHESEHAEALHRWVADNCDNRGNPLPDATGCPDHSEALPLAPTPPAPTTACPCGYDPAENGRETGLGWESDPPPPCCDIVAAGPSHACGADPDDACPDCSRPGEEPTPAADPAADERAAIVAWLHHHRDECIYDELSGGYALHLAIEAIERGEHRKERAK